MPAQCGSAPKGAVHLSCFLRDQLYPGIRDKNGKRRDKAQSTRPYRMGRCPAGAGT